MAERNRKWSCTDVWNEKKEKKKKREKKGKVGQLVMTKNNDKEMVKQWSQVCENGQ